MVWVLASNLFLRYFKTLHIEEVSRQTRANLNSYRNLLVRPIGLRLPLTLPAPERLVRKFEHGDTILQTISIRTHTKCPVVQWLMLTRVSRSLRNSIPTCDYMLSIVCTPFHAYKYLKMSNFYRKQPCHFTKYERQLFYANTNIKCLKHTKTTFIFD